MLTHARLQPTMAKTTILAIMLTIAFILLSNDILFIMYVVTVLSLHTKLRPPAVELTCLVLNTLLKVQNMLDNVQTTSRPRLMPILDIPVVLGPLLTVKTPPLKWAPPYNI